ncbi:hypothetical protein N7495_007103 [Penicillium taxi]|uniref:uncharacterized protein n=1 Tax=Penicillium taxi TaxID=168475 RepID=UPI002545BD95|nr:uncharacterized protein N7495_007103 [Penicillium taxi]KAJ5895412.1 hypothetical protein N7495_007103 [Penicillium taxi]
MECLSVGRHSLSTRVCPYSFSNRLFSSLSRQYASASTPRRMAAQNWIGNLESSAKNSQAYPLSGYYKLVLNNSTRYTPTAPSTPAQPEHDSKPATKEQTPQEKMAIVFGTRLAGPGRTSRYNPGEMPPEAQWKTINGVPIPPQPEEPDNCCMSGCVHCVWDDFRDEMEDWAGRVATAKAKGSAENGTKDIRTVPQTEVHAAHQSMDDDGGASESNWPAPSQDEDLFAGIPVGIREFMRTEKKLRERKEAKKETA